MGRRIGEWDAIGILRGTSMVPSIGVYDDAYPLRCCGRTLVLKPDAVARSTDMLPGMPLELFARKAVVAALSDVSVKGGRPLWFTSTVLIPDGEATEEAFSAMRDGFARASMDYGVELVAGDVGASKELAIDIEAVGIADRFVGRAGGRPGDLVYVAGWGIGYTWLGYRVLLEGRREEAPDEYVDMAVRHLYEPRVPAEFNVAASERVDASMDSSDGLAMTLHELASLGRLSIVVESLPLDAGYVEALGAASLDPIEATFYGGEEYAAVGLVRPDDAAELRSKADELGIPIWIIGRAVEGPPSVVLSRSAGERVELRKAGWSHFR